MVVVVSFLPRDAHRAVLLSRPSICLSVRDVDVPWAYRLG